MRPQREQVWCVWHSYAVDDVDETKFIGVFRTRARARSAVSALRSAPGFRAHPRRFVVSAVTLDRVGWSEGFVRVDVGTDA